MNSKKTKEEVAKVIDDETQNLLSDMMQQDIVMVSHVINRWGVNNFIKGMYNMGVDFGYQVIVPTNGSNEVH